MYLYVCLFRLLLYVHEYFFHTRVIHSHSHAIIWKLYVKNFNLNPFIVCKRYTLCALIDHVIAMRFVAWENALKIFNIFPELH